MSQHNGTPEFDFSNLSWGDEKVLAQMNLKLRKANDENDAQLMQEAHTGIDQYFAKCITHIPANWLVKDAPANLDWTNPESQNYILGSKIGDLRAEMAKAKQGN